MGILNDINFKEILLKAFGFIVLIFVGVYSREYGIFWLNTLIRLILVYILLNIFFHVIFEIIMLVYRKKYNLNKDHRDNFVNGINGLLFFFSNVIFILIVLTTLNIDVFSLLTSLTIVAVAIVLTFKEFISNFLNGINLMFSKKLNMGNYVKIGESKGRIVNISFQDIELKTDTGDIIYIPNYTVQTKDIVNFSKNSMKKFYHEIIINSSKFKVYEKNIEKIKKKLIEKYSDIISKEEILFSINKVEKEQFTVLVEIQLLKYNYKTEQEVKNFVSEKFIEVLS